MNRAATAATAASTMGLLSACAGPLLAPEERKQVCQVAVDAKFGAPTSIASVSNSAGWLSGTAAGAWQALSVPARWAWIVTVPVGAAVGAVEARPVRWRTRATHRQRGYREDSEDGRCRQPRPCASKRISTHHARDARRENRMLSTAPVPDTVIEIEDVDVTTGCAFGKQEYVVAVKWRVLIAADGRQRAETTTRCARPPGSTP